MSAVYDPRRERPDLEALKGLCEFCRHDVLFTAVLFVGPGGWRTPAQAAKDWRVEYARIVTDCREHHQLVGASAS